MIKYAIKEIAYNNQWIVKHCYTEFTDDITHATLFDTIKDVQAYVDICKQELVSEYKYEIHTIEIQDIGIIANSSIESEKELEQLKYYSFTGVKYNIGGFIKSEPIKPIYIKAKDENKAINIAIRHRPELAIGMPLCSVLSETYIQFMKNNGIVEYFYTE